MRRRNQKEDRYRDVVNVQRDNSDDGVKTPNWVNFATNVPCKVVDVTGMSSYRGLQLDETLSTVVEMYYLDGLKPSMQIVFGSRTLKPRFIKEIRKYNAREKHWIFCNELVT